MLSKIKLIKHLSYCTGPQGKHASIGHCYGCYGGVPIGQARKFAALQLATVRLKETTGSYPTYTNEVVNNNDSMHLGNNNVSTIHAGI